MLVTTHLSLSGSILTINGDSFPLDERENIYVIGAGKASAAMAHYVETIMGERITGGHIVTKYDHSCKLKRIKVTEAGHPIPDANGFTATEEILKIAEKACERDLVLCLISGGGSALLADLPEGLLPEELYIVNNLLIRCGASINEINCVRKHLSRVKGRSSVGQYGLLPYIAYTFRRYGNPLDVIASGPTVPEYVYNEALRSLKVIT
jgi:hydroxypyruvate reductase/glycerate 2-kinase